MNKRCPSLLLLMAAWLLLPAALFPQTSFERIYRFMGYNFNLIELDDGRIRACAIGAITIGQNGEALQAEGFYDNMMHLNVMQSMKQSRRNDYYYVTGFHDGSCPEDTVKWLMHPVIGRMDSVGHTTALRYYELNSGRCDGIGSDLEITSDRSVLAWGRWPHCMLLKVDSALNLQWARSFNAVGQFEFVKELPGGDLLAGINTDTAAAVLARFSPGGDLLWCKSYFRPGGRIHDAAIGPDSSIVVVGYTDHADQLAWPVGFQPKLFLMKVDGTGDVQWCRGYANNTYRWATAGNYDARVQIRSTPTGDFVLLAPLGQEAYNRVYKPYLMRTDQNGDTLWTRSVGWGGNIFGTQDLLLCSDGGIAFSGDIWGDLPLSDWSIMGYIYKTDPWGHFPCHEEHFPVQTMELFPLDSAFTLSSVDGATAFPAFVNDTTYEVLPDFDACDPLQVSDPFSASRHTTIHPNPNTGRFTVAFPDPLTADSFYSVYDAVGKLLLQRPLARGTESEEIDLSRFGAGTYLVRITSKDGVCNERVVVQ